MVKLTITVKAPVVGNSFLKAFLLEAILSGEKPPADVVDKLKTTGKASITSPFGSAVYEIEES